MSILQQYKAEHPELTKVKTEKSTATPLNLPIKCVGYEDDVLLGIRLDTNEEVKIKLMTIEQKTTSKYKRIEIKDFANEKSKHYAAPGQAVFIAETCYHAKDDLYNCRWLKVISTDPLKTKIDIFNCSLVNFKKKLSDDQVNEIIFVKVAIPEKAKIINSNDELESVMSGLLNPRHIGSNPFCYVRIKDNNSNDVEFVEVTPQRTEREDGLGKKCVEGSVSAKAFMDSPESKMIRDLLDSSSDEVTVDVIPGSVIYPGTATKEKMIESHPNAKKILEESFYIPSANEGGYPEVGYLKCVLATRKHADGTSYFTFVKPIFQYVEAISVKNIK